MGHRQVRHRQVRHRQDACATRQMPHCGADVTVSRDRLLQQTLLSSRLKKAIYCYPPKSPLKRGTFNIEVYKS